MGILKDIREVLRGLKRGKMGKRTPKFCPKCGSPRIRLISSFDVYPKMYGLTPGKYFCENCGYKGPVVMELEEEGPSNRASPAPAVSSNSCTDF